MQIKMEILKEDRKGRPSAFTVFLFYLAKKNTVFSNGSVRKRLRFY